MSRSYLDTRFRSERKDTRCAPGRAGLTHATLGWPGVKGRWLVCARPWAALLRWSLPCTGPGQAHEYMSVEFRTSEWGHAALLTCFVNIQVVTDNLWTVRKSIRSDWIYHRNYSRDNKINCKGKFVSWYWKNSKVLINLYVNFQKNILICLHGDFYNDWAKCKTLSLDEKSSPINCPNWGHRQWWDWGNCSQHSECYDEAWSSTCDNDTLSCVNML